MPAAILAYSEVFGIQNGGRRDVAEMLKRLTSRSNGVSAIFQYASDVFDDDGSRVQRNRCGDRGNVKIVPGVVLPCFGLYPGFATS